jgi:hypothetical protein
MHSSSLIDSLAARVDKRGAEEEEKDNSNFVSYNTLDTLMTEEDEDSRIKLRPFSRKTSNASKLHLGALDRHNLQDALADIRRNCSPRTYHAINNLVEQEVKLRKTINELKLQGLQPPSAPVRSRPESDRSGNDQIIM